MKIQDFSNTAEFLATLTRDQLKEYAKNNAGNPYLVSLALFVSDQQKAEDRNKQAKAQPQGSVVDNAINNIAPMARATMPAEEVAFDMPEDSGIGQIPVDDTYYGAEGGIIAFAEPTEDNNYSLVTDPQFGGSTGEIAVDRPRPTREQVNATIQALRGKQTLGLSDIRDIESGRLTAPSQAAAPQVVDLPPEVGVGSGRTMASTSAPMSATPRGASMPSSKPMGIKEMYQAMKEERAVADSPFKSQLEALARSEQETAAAETAGLEKIQEKYADITKGQRSRQDAKEKAIEAMDNQGLGILLLLNGAEIMSKRNPDLGVGVKGYLANRDKVASARDKLSESRDRLEAAEAQRGELNATQLNKLRMNERRVGIAAQKEMLQAIQDEYKVSKDEGLKILDLQIREGISLQEQDRADRRTMMQINAKDRSPTQQIFDRLVAQKGGDPVAAQQEYTRLFGDKPDTAYRQELLKKKADVISGPMGNSELGLKQLAAIDAEIAKLSRTTAPAKTATMADIEATAKARGKTVQETLAAAKSQGFVVQ
jgi:hypothetical protein